MLRAHLLLSLGLAAAGCLPDDQLPDGAVPPPPPSCGNKRCEASLSEHNVNCETDCPHCYAVLVTGQAGLLEDAAGVPDGKSVTVKEFTLIDLSFGRPIQRNLNKTGLDVKLVGQVTGSAPPPAADCPSFGSEFAAGAVRVRASEDGSVWKTIGMWTQAGPSEFRLACADQVSSARWLRLEALQATSFQLDAAQALSCVP